MEIRFEWDLAKAKSNLVKHGVTFQEAKSVFYDGNARVIPETSTTLSEERLLILGMSDNLHLLVICHCYRSRDEVIRIISARKATVHESRAYEEYLS
jgi:uncharacterized DUF497 family protein